MVKLLLILFLLIPAVSHANYDIPALWSNYYQGTGDLSKENRARTALQDFRYTDIPIDAQKAIKEAIFIFGGDMGISPVFLADLLAATGKIESNYLHRRQIGGGPARSYWQVEPKTALDLLKNASPLFGPKFRNKFPDVKRDINWLANELEENVEFAAAMAAAKWIVVLSQKKY